LKKTLVWFKFACEQRDVEAEKLRRELDEAERNLERVLQDNDRLNNALDEATVDQKLYDKLFLEQSFLENAITEYEGQAEINKTRAEKAEADLLDLQRKYVNLETVKAFLEQQVKILNREQQKNGIGDLIGSNISSASSTPNGMRASPSSSTVSTLSENFIRSAAGHVAHTQAAISQFCGAYGFRLEDEISLNDLCRLDKKDEAIQVGLEEDSTKQRFCPDCVDLRHEKSESQRSHAKKLKEKDRKIKSLQSELAKTESELRQQGKEMKTHRSNIRKQNDTITELLAKLGAMQDENDKLRSKNKELQKRQKEMRSTEVPVVEIEESLSSADQGGRSSNASNSSVPDSNSSSTPAKRKRSDWSSDEEEDHGNEKRVEPPNGAFSP